MIDNSKDQHVIMTLKSNILNENFIKMYITFQLYVDLIFWHDFNQKEKPNEQLFPSLWYLSSFLFIYIFSFYLITGRTISESYQKFQKKQENMNSNQKNIGNNFLPNLWKRPSFKKEVALQWVLWMAMEIKTFVWYMTFLYHV